jgi:hypothetical protein
MNIAYIRKLAMMENGRRYLEKEAQVDPVSELLLQRASTANDRELLKISSVLPGDTMENYEAMGGTFDKEAIGAPMFQAPKIQLPQIGLLGQGQQGGSGVATSGLGAANKLQGPPKVPGVSEPKVPGQSMGTGQQGTGKVQ